jgi:hypothetical protein
MGLLDIVNFKIKEKEIPVIPAETGLVDFGQTLITNAPIKSLTWAGVSYLILTPIMSNTLPNVQAALTTKSGLEKMLRALPEKRQIELEKVLEKSPGKELPFGKRDTV